MIIRELSVEGYRSIRSLQLRLDRINVIVGPNGCGKTNLYRSVFLLFAAAQGRLARTLVEEGGMPSVLWAGKRKRNTPVRMVLCVTLDDLSYELQCGLPRPPAGPFLLDPLVKEETIRYLGG